MIVPFANKESIGFFLTLNGMIYLPIVLDVSLLCALSTYMYMILYNFLCILNMFALFLG